MYLIVINSSLIHVLPLCFFCISLSPHFSLPPPSLLPHFLPPSFLPPSSPPPPPPSSYPSKSCVATSGTSVTSHSTRRAPFSSSSSTTPAWPLETANRPCSARGCLECPLKWWQSEWWHVHVHYILYTQMYMYVHVSLCTSICTVHN